MLALKSSLLSELSDPQIDAVVEAMLLAAHADGELDPSEISQLKKSLLDIDHLWLSHIDLEQRIETAKSHIAGHDRTDRLQSLRQTLDKPEQRIAALELAALVIASDGILRTSERDLMLEAAEILGVDSGVVADIVKQVAK